MAVFFALMRRQRFGISSTPLSSVRFPFLVVRAVGESAFFGNLLSGSLPFALAALSNLKRLNLGTRNFVESVSPL